MAEGEFNPLGGLSDLAVRGIVFTVGGIIGLGAKAGEQIAAQVQKFKDEQNFEAQRQLETAMPGLTKSFVDLKPPNQPPQDPKKKRKPGALLRPTPGKQSTPLQFPDFFPGYQPELIPQPAPIPDPFTIPPFQELPERRLPPPADVIPGVNPPPPPIDRRPPPVTTVRTPIKDIDFPFVFPPVDLDQPIVYDVCDWSVQPDEVAALQEVGFIRWAAQKEGLTEEGRENYLLEDGMALLITATGNQLAEYVVETGVVFGLDAIQTLLHAPTLMADSARFPVQVGIPPGVVVRSCAKSIKSVSVIPPLATDDEGCCVCPEQKINECFVPVRNFKSNEPNGVGYKSQIQIDFTDDDGNVAKEITVPDPKTIITTQLINDLLEPMLEDGGIYFGEVKCEVDIAPYGYIRLYAFDEARGRQLIYRLADLSNGAIVPKSFRASNRQRDIKVGLYKPYKATEFEFRRDGSEPKCRIHWLQSPIV
jgi:hypothetical protein